MEGLSEVKFPLHWGDPPQVNASTSISKSTQQADQVRQACMERSIEIEIGWRLLRTGNSCL